MPATPGRTKNKIMCCQIGSRSSVYSPESRVRKTGSFIYEDFMPTDGTDVKVTYKCQFLLSNPLLTGNFIIFISSLFLSLGNLIKGLKILWCIIFQVFTAVGSN